MIRRAFQELRPAPSPTEVERALALVLVRIEDGAAIVSRAAGRPLLTVAKGEAEAGVARLGAGLYATIPTAAARVRVLGACASIAPRLEIHAPVIADGTYRGRLLIDVPRRIGRGLGLPAAEPGDRFSSGFTHVFFDDEPLLVEAGRAGLGFVARREAWLVLARVDGPPPEPPDAFARELARAARVIAAAEQARNGASPELAVQAMRARGRREKARGPVGRARLRRAIGWVDAAFPGGPNCFRRTLAEVALDAGAARDTLVFGLDVGRTGHVAFKGSEDRRFDVAFEIAAPPKG